MIRGHSWAGKAAVLLCCLAVAAGCARQKIIDNLGIVIALGYDEVKEGNDRIRTTIIAYQETDGRANPVRTSAANNTSKGVRTKLNLKMPSQDVIGQVRVVVYGESLAKKGIINLTDTLQRDSEIGTNVCLAIASGSAKSIMSASNKQDMSMGEFLFELIRKNEKYGVVPSPSLHYFLNSYYRVGKDPVLPFLKRGNREVSISSLALMKEDRMVGKLNEDECFLLKSTMGNYHFDSLELALSLKHDKPELPAVSPLFITLTNIRTSSRIRLVGQDDPVFEVRIRVNGQLKEISEQINLEKGAEFNALEREASAKITELYEELYGRLQRLGTDPVGFGSIYRSSVRIKGLTSKQWEEMYKRARFRTDIKVEFTNVGITS